jgi:L-ascorbate metabolism protein UlaG (beta-lactamase superfamily)
VKSLGARAAGERLERMRASTQWVQATATSAAGFRNRAPIRAGRRDASAPRPTLTEFLRGGNRRVPTGTLPLFDPRETWRKPPGLDLRATWLGHSSVLIEIAGKRILTDPVWGPRASPSRLAGPKRFHPVPVALRALPPLDAVLISHDHYDHLCMATVRDLARLQPTAPSQHFSGRGLKDRNATLWSSLIIESERERVFFSGDTGLTDQYAEIQRRFAKGKNGTPFDLVMLEVGAFHPSWGDIHLGPKNALEALALLGGGAFLPVHWGTFSLALHPWDEPAETLLSMAPACGVHLVMPHLGEPVVPANADGVRPWWRGVDTRISAPADVLTWPKALPFPLD